VRPVSNGIGLFSVCHVLLRGATVSRRTRCVLPCIEGPNTTARATSKLVPPSLRSFRSRCLSLAGFVSSRNRPRRFRFLCPASGDCCLTHGCMAAACPPEVIQRLPSAYKLIAEPNNVFGVAQAGKIDVQPLQCRQGSLQSPRRQHRRCRYIRCPELANWSGLCYRTGTGLAYTVEVNVQRQQLVKDACNRAGTSIADVVTRDVQHLQIGEVRCNRAGTSLADLGWNECSGSASW